MESCTRIGRRERRARSRWGDVVVLGGVVVDASESFARLTYRAPDNTCKVPARLPCSPARLGEPEGQRRMSVDQGDRSPRPFTDPNVRDVAHPTLRITGSLQDDKSKEPRKPAA